MGQQGPLELTTVTAGRTAPGRRRSGWPLVLTALAVLAALTAAATGLRAGGTLAAWEQAAVETTDAQQLRLGWFGNLTHAPALVGGQLGYFEEALGATQLSTQVFNTGPTTLEAMNAGELDAAFLGPSPALNSYLQSGGQSLAIVAGATSGGAQFVVSSGVGGADDLAGRTLATPDFGGTQDVALRVWLAEHGYTVDGGGESSVAINPMPNGQAHQLFQQGRLAGGWLPQPWATRLVQEEGAKVLVDEADLWPGGRFPTTVLAVRKDYLEQHPQTVEKLLRGLDRSVTWLHEHEGDPVELAGVLNAGLRAAKTEPLPQTTLIGALEQMTFGTDPMAETYPVLLAHGVQAGTTQEGSVDGIVDTTALDRARSGGEDR